jgi:hypothetical protein
MIAALEEGQPVTVWRASLIDRRQVVEKVFENGTFKLDDGTFWKKDGLPITASQRGRRVAPLQRAELHMIERLGNVARVEELLRWFLYEKRLKALDQGKLRAMESILTQYAAAIINEKHVGAQLHVLIQRLNDAQARVSGEVIAPPEEPG